MLKSYEQIYGEVQTAVDNALHEPTAPILIDPPARGRGHGFSSLAELPDDAEVSDFWQTVPVAGPATVLYETAEELEQALHALEAVTDRKAPKREIPDTVAHERIHHAAAMQARFRVGRFGMFVVKQRLDPSVSRVLPGASFYRPAEPIEPITKLALGSVVVAPGRGSSYEDHGLAYSMNYSAAIVATRIRTATDPRLRSLRMPDGF